jgi:hypothetical protein
VARVDIVQEFWHCPVCGATALKHYNLYHEPYLQCTGACGAYTEIRAIYRTEVSYENDH